MKSHQRIAAAVVVVVVCCYYELEHEKKDGSHAANYLLSNQHFDFDYVDFG